jgi:hypothetical protein
MADNDLLGAVQLFAVALGEESAVQAIKLCGVHVCPQRQPGGPTHLIERLLKLPDDICTRDALLSREFPEVL